MKFKNMIFTNPKFIKILIKIILIIYIFILYFSQNLSMAEPLNSSSDSSSTTNAINTYSPVCLLMEAKTGKVIYEKNGYEKMYPASTTKIMTAILTLEHCELTDVATASYNAVFSVPVRIF